LERVNQPERAQVRILRRRPPLRGGRASHGRAELRLAVVQRQEQRQLEPQVLVQISPGQRSSAIQATALHELGHAFGLWGHSDSPGDAMAAVPGPTPVLELSPRDRATFLWLQQQPGLAQPPPPLAP
jgi:predicted Zn-dependent protease